MVIKKKENKNKFYYEWQGMEDFLQTIKNIYRKQDTAFKFNISLAYLLRRPLYEYEYNNGGKIIGVIRQLGYEYKYQYNNEYKYQYKSS